MDTDMRQNGPDGEQCVERTVTVHDGLGLHARPAARLAREASRFRAEVTLSHGDVTVDAKSILDILCLAATQGTFLTLRCWGEDAEQAVQALAALFQQSVTGGEK